MKMKNVEITEAFNSPDYGDLKPGDVLPVSEVDAEAFQAAGRAKKTNKKPSSAEAAEGEVSDG